jgi:hypothetical protein
MFVFTPAQHEVSDEASGLSKLRRDEERVVLLGLVGPCDATLECRLGLVSVARHGIEIAVYGFVGEDECEVVKIASLESSKRESGGCQGSGELDHPSVLVLNERARVDSSIL